MYANSWIPLGFNQITVAGTVAGLSGTAGEFIIPSKANRILMSAETVALRWRDDNVVPTANVGMLLPTGLAPFDYSGSLTALKFRSSTGAAGLLTVLYYFDPGLT